MHIAYFQNWGLGDLVMTVPALTELRRIYPEAKLTLVVRGKAQTALLEGNPLVDQVLNMPPRARKLALAKFLWRLRHERIDVAFVGTRISPLLPLLLRSITGVRTLVGDGAAAKFLYTVHVPVAEGVHRVDRMRQAVSAFSNAELDPVRFPLAVSASEQARADTYLLDRGLQRGSYIVIHPGSSAIAGTDKRIPAEVVRRTIAGIRARRPDARVALLFGPDELDLVDSYAPYDECVVAFTGTSLGVTQSLLAGARAFVGTDSAPGHLAAAAGTPTFTVAGPTKPLETAPWGPNARVVTRTEPFECQPCWGTPLYGKCPFGVRCMLGLPEEDLVAAVCEIIDRPA
jgi:ADP-heptose:LPS heptosyltransferase